MYNIVVVLINTAMREWRNRQTRTFEGRVGDRTGSIPVSRTKQIRECKSTPLFVCHGMRNLICHSNACVRGSGAQIRQKDVPRLRGNSVTNLVHEVNLPVFYAECKNTPFFVVL